MSRSPDMPEGLTAVELAVYRHLLASVAQEMGLRLMRSAYSANIKERRDFSCALFDAAGDMIAQAAHIPVHLGSSPASVQAVRAAFGDAMAPGQRFIVNDPFAGGTHLPDITVVAPLFRDGAAAPAFFVANRAHHADVGGITPGSLPLSTSIDQEGVRVGPSRLDGAVVDRICAASRTPDERRGDLRAQNAALDIGLARLDALCQAHGTGRIAEAGAALQAYTARMIRSVIASMPDGVYRFEDVLDDDGHGHTDIAIRCRLTVDGDRATADFRTSDAQVPGSLNAVRAITLSAVMYAFRCLASADIPGNSGVLRPVAVLTRPGTVVDALPPAAVAGGNVETSQRITDVVFGALAQALPDRVPAASSGTMNNLTLGSLDGDPAPFAYYETLAGGAGGGPDGPGGSAIQCHMTNTLNTPVEALEQTYPFRIEACAIRNGSGGAGGTRGMPAGTGGTSGSGARGELPGAACSAVPYRGKLPGGGDGMVRRYVFDRAAQVTLLTERRTHRPWGLGGGGPGAAGLNTLIRADGTRQALPGKCSITVGPGDRLEIQTPGGGGWSPPPEVSPAQS